MMACECEGVACRIGIYGGGNKKRRANEDSCNDV